MNDMDVSPRDVYRQTGRWLPPALFILAVVFAAGLGLAFAGWQAGWWFTNHNAARQYQVTQNGVSNQDTLRAQVTAKLADVATITSQIAAAGTSPAEVAALKDQRAAIAGIACADAAQITTIPLPAQQARWVTVNCQAGSVSPASPLNVTGAP
jgi:hypothetical protein